MANEKHLYILKQGVEGWNAWRQENPSIHPDLRGAELGPYRSGDNEYGHNLNEADLHEADLRLAYICRVNLSKADLEGAILRGAHLNGANLYGANLSKANLNGALIEGAKLFRTNLKGASLRQASFSKAEFYGADLSLAKLHRANFTAAIIHRGKFNGADLSGAVLRETKFVDVDLTDAIGLARCQHLGQSTVDHRTLTISKNVPTHFWRGCGLPQRLIDYLPSILDQAFEFYSCFISYSSKDQEFADRLHADLQDNGVRCWFAPHDMRTGDRIRDTIDEQIRIHEKLLLILSDSSVSSNWVENEVEAAMDRERNRETVLFPVQIDDAVDDSDVAWARTIKRTRQITDFSCWKEHDAYRKSLARLLQDLKVER